MSLTKRQQMKKHSEHHSKSHMAMMRRLMNKGVSFSSAHKKAQKEVGK